MNTDPLPGLSECVDLSTFAARYRDLLAALTACGERLIDPAVNDAEQRGQLLRLAGTIIGGSFIVSAALASILPAHAGPATLLAAISATLAISWLAALSVARPSVARVAAMIILAAAIVLLPLLTLAAGGAASPVAMLLCALVIEPFWVRRDKSSLAIGAISFVAAAGLLIAGSPAVAAPSSPLQWLAPVLYAGLLGLRFAPAAAQQQIVQPSLDLASAFGWPVMIFRGGELVDVASNGAPVLGVPSQLLLGGGLLDRVHVADRVKFLCALAELRAGAARRSLQLRLRLPNNPVEPSGTVYRAFEMDFFALDEGDGAFAAVLRDAGDAEALRSDLAKAQESAEHLKIARNRLLASVSHELRTPLNAIIGFSDMMLLDLCGPINDPRQRQHIELVRDSGQHLLGVVNAILDVSRIESGSHEITPEPFSLSESIALCRSMMQGQAQAKNVTLTSIHDVRLGEIVADRRAVQQILVNLVANSIKFTPTGGSVSIGAERIGKCMKFWVSDNGIGIAPHDLCKLGEPFTQIRNDYSREHDGVGLGLSLVKGLVALHGGSMEIDSAEGDGTTVTISLPIDGPVRQDEKRLVALDDQRPKETRHVKLRKTA